MAFISVKISLGKEKEIPSQFHSWKLAISFNLRSSSPLLSGPQMQLLRVPMFNHLSNHSERSLSFPANYLAPLLTMLSPFFMPDQVEEQDVGLRRLVGLLLLPRYLWDRTRTHNDDFSVLNLQFSLANNAAFFGLAA